MAAVLLLAAIAALLSCGAAQPPPNVILVVIDTLRYDHLSQYGYGLQTSPGLQLVADRATRFERAYAPSSWTTPSTASILSGLWPASHGTGVLGQKLSPEVVSLAEVLRDHGFETAGFSHNIPVSAAGGFDQGFDTFVDHDGGALAYPDVSEMVSAVDGWLAGRDTERPFFLYLQPMNCHGPYRVPEEQRGVLLGRPPDATFKYQGALMMDIMRDGRLEARNEVTDDYVESLREIYDTAIRYTTDEIGRLLAGLDDELLDRTLIVIASDHGEELFDHQGFGHAYSLFEEVVRVPLLVKAAGQRNANVRSEPVSLLDIFPTVVDAVGLDVEHEIQGLPLPIEGRRRPPSEGAERPGRELIFDIRWASRAVGGALLIDPFKLINMRENYEGKEQKIRLFDLSNDPDEQHDLVAPELERAQQMRILLNRLSRRLLARGLEAPTRDEEIDPDALRALGYVD